MKNAQEQTTPAKPNRIGRAGLAVAFLAGSALMSACGVQVTHGSAPNPKPVPEHVGARPEPINNKPDILKSTTTTTEPKPEAASSIPSSEGDADSQSSDVTTTTIAAPAVSNVAPAPAPASPDTVAPVIGQGNYSTNPATTPSTVPPVIGPGNYQVNPAYASK